MTLQETYTKLRGDYDEVISRLRSERLVQKFVLKFPADGSFDLDIRDGELSFKLTSSYMDSLLSKDALNYMFAMACMIVDRYNDRLVLVNEGLLNPFEVVEE